MVKDNNSRGAQGEKGACYKMDNQRKLHEGGGTWSDLWKIDGIEIPREDGKHLREGKWQMQWKGD